MMWENIYLLILTLEALFLITILPFIVDDFVWKFRDKFRDWGLYDDYTSARIWIFTLIPLHVFLSAYVNPILSSFFASKGGCL